MATNYIQDGNVLPVVAPAGGCVSGNIYKVGGIVGVAIASAAEGATVQLQTVGVFSLAKTSAQAWAVGDPVYLDAATLTLTKASAAGLFLVGVATAVAANPSAVGSVRLNGNFGIAAQAA